MKTIHKVKKLLAFGLACALLLPDLTALAGTDGRTDAALAFDTHMDLYGCVYSDGSWTSETYKELADYSKNPIDNDLENFTFFSPVPVLITMVLLRLSKMAVQ